MSEEKRTKTLSVTFWISAVFESTSKITNIVGRPKMPPIGAQKMYRRETFGGLPEEITDTVLCNLEANMGRIIKAEFDAETPEMKLVSMAVVITFFAEVSSTGQKLIPIEDATKVKANLNEVKVN